MRGRVRRRSYARAGRLVPSWAKRLRGRSVRLSSGEGVAWHSTDDREEILIALAGSLQLEVAQDRDRVKRVTLSAGHSAFLSHAVRHRVLNRSRHRAHYLYLTA